VLAESTMTQRSSSLPLPVRIADSLETAVTASCLVKALSVGDILVGSDRAEDTKYLRFIESRFSPSALDLARPRDVELCVEVEVVERDSERVYESWDRVGISMAERYVRGRDAANVVPLVLLRVPSVDRSTRI